MERIAQLGIPPPPPPGAEFTWASFDAQVQQAIREGVETGKAAIHEQEAHLGEHINGRRRLRLDQPVLVSGCGPAECREIVHSSRCRRGRQITTFGEKD